MNGGNSDTDLLVLRATGAGFEEFQRLPRARGEDAEFFRIGERAFPGHRGHPLRRRPVYLRHRAAIFTWDGSGFVPFQSVPGYAGKQWRHIPIGDRHFLGLAQGVVLPGPRRTICRPESSSGDAETFVPFQDIPSRVGLQLATVHPGRQHFLAHGQCGALDAVPLGRRLVRRAPGAGRPARRAFADFEADGEHFLLVRPGCQSESELLRWDGERFLPPPEAGRAGRPEFAVIRGEARAVRSPSELCPWHPGRPETALTSQLYRWEHGALTVVEEFPTTGGTDVAVFHDAAGPLVGVTNSLTEDIRFARQHPPSTGSPVDPPHPSEDRAWPATTPRTDRAVHRLHSQRGQHREPPDPVQRRAHRRRPADRGHRHRPRALPRRRPATPGRRLPDVPPEDSKSWPESPTSTRTGLPGQPSAPCAGTAPGGRRTAPAAPCRHRPRRQQPHTLARHHRRTGLPRPRTSHHRHDRLHLRGHRPLPAHRPGRRELLNARTLREDYLEATPTPTDNQPSR